MALIFLGVLIVFTVPSFEFQQVRLPWLHCQWWVAPIYLTSVSPLDCRFGGNAGSYRKLQQKPKTVPEFVMHFIWFCLPYWRKPLTTLWKTTTSNCRYVCQPTVVWTY